MAAKMRDLIIVLPGIMGSALQKNGTDIWALSGQAIWQHLAKLGSLIHQLRIKKERLRDRLNLLLSDRQRWISQPRTPQRDHALRQISHQLRELGTRNPKAGRKGKSP